MNIKIDSPTMISIMMLESIRFKNNSYNIPSRRQDAARKE